MPMRRLLAPAVLISVTACGRAHRDEIEQVYEAVTPATSADLDRAVAGLRSRLDERALEDRVERRGATIVVSIPRAHADAAEDMAALVTRVLEPVDLVALAPDAQQCPLVDALGSLPTSDVVGRRDANGGCWLEASDRDRTVGATRLADAVTALRSGGAQLDAGVDVVFEREPGSLVDRRWRTRAVLSAPVATGRWYTSAQLWADGAAHRSGLTVALAQDARATIAAAFARPARLALRSVDRLVLAPVEVRAAPSGDRLLLVTGDDGDAALRTADETVERLVQAAMPPLRRVR